MDRSKRHCPAGAPCLPGKPHVMGWLLLVLLGTVTAFSPAWAATVIFRDSTGHTELVDTNNPGWHALPPVAPTTISPQKAGGVTFNVYYADPANVGFNDPVNGPARKARVAEIFSYLGGLFNHTGVCDVQFAPSQFDGSGPLATGGTSYWIAPGYTNGWAFDHITTGVDPQPGQADIDVTVDLGWNWYTGTGTPGGSQSDFLTVLLHEITHGLGLSSLTDRNGAGLSYNQMAKWDDFLETGSGKKLWNASGGFVGTSSDLVGGDGGIRFRGPNAMAAYGSKPPIYAPNPFQDGSSIAHFDQPIPNCVMRPILYPGTTCRQYAVFERGALKDIGYSLIEFQFLQLPQGGMFEVGSALNMAVTYANAVGSGQYQWKKNGGDIPGATLSSYSIDPLAISDTGWYSCSVTDQAPATYTTPQTYVAVYSQGSLPTTGLVGLCIVGVVCILAGAFVIMRKV